MLLKNCMFLGHQSYFFVTVVYGFFFQAIGSNFVLIFVKIVCIIWIFYDFLTDSFD